MPPDSNSNAPSSAPTSPTAAQAPKGPTSESAFLTRQAADASAAISRVVDDIKNDLAQGVDPRAWVAAAPWTTLATAAVAGFVAAAVAVPSKEQQALKRLARIEAALNGHRPARNGHGPHDEEDAARRVESGRGSFLSNLAGQVLRAVQPVLMSAITAGVTAKTVQPEAPTGGADPNAAAGAPPAPNGATQSVKPGEDPGI